MSTDAYGGSVENRARLMVEMVEGMIGAWDAKHVGVRLSPSSYLYGVDDSDKRATFGHVMKKLNGLGLAYIFLLEPNTKDAERGVQIPNVADTFRALVSVPLIINTGFRPRQPALHRRRNPSRPTTTTAASHVIVPPELL